MSTNKTTIELTPTELIDLDKLLRVSSEDHALAVTGDCDNEYAIIILSARKSLGLSMKAAYAVNPKHEAPAKTDPNFPISGIPTEDMQPDAVPKEPAMELKVGCSYRTRGGSIVAINDAAPDAYTFPFYGQFLFPEESCGKKGSWTKNGNYLRDSIHENDLVELVGPIEPTEKLSLEAAPSDQPKEAETVSPKVGCKYRTRDGSIVAISGVLGMKETFPVCGVLVFPEEYHGGCSATWTIDGKYLGGSIHRYDLVELIEEPSEPPPASGPDDDIMF